MLQAAARPNRYGYYLINSVITIRYSVNTCDSRAHVQDALGGVNAIDAGDSGAEGLAPIRKVSKPRRDSVAAAIFCTARHDSNGQGIWVDHGPINPVLGVWNPMRAGRFSGL